MIIDTRKRKRMLSNRESARRSRTRKQKHMDDLTAQVTNLRAENNVILNNINFATHLYLNMESENSVLGAQISELNHRLQALNDIINYAISNDIFAPSFEIGGYGIDDYDHMIGGVDDVLSPWSLVHVNQPIMASPDVFMY
ncbi:ocs element-binding factor 1 [Phtheirospermum japonicum]|uniref:Ocs element-binding factor 1 n=1 Tax=Phtheirospermum japonicum TaxID=374723 RepID=A0A830D1T1_9LAMI|nr:ocs element-binding factor 1 [Phtheirospermum japonicum]